MSRAANHRSDTGPPLRGATYLWRKLKFSVNFLAVKIRERMPQRFRAWIASKLVQKTEARQQAAARGGGLSEALPSPVNAQIFAPEFRELVAEVSAFVERVALPNTLPNFSGDTEQALKHLLIDFQSATALERASRFIFGSQVETLIYLGTAGGMATKTEIIRHYDAAKASYPDIYARYSFDGWLVGFSFEEWLDLD